MTKQRTVNKKKTDGDLADIDETKKQLETLEANERPKPRFPKSLYDDVTPEPVKYSLVMGWPSGAMITSEGGIIVGGRAMSDESALNLLTFLNIVFEGQTLRIERRSGGSQGASGRRFSASLAMQWIVFDQFMQAAGGKARGAPG